VAPVLAVVLTGKEHTTLPGARDVQAASDGIVDDATAAIVGSELLIEGRPVISLHRSDDLRTACRRFRTLTSDTEGRSARVGVGWGDNSHTAREHARAAVSLGSVLTPGMEVVLFPDIQVAYDILRLGDVRGYISIIEPLLAHDRRYASGLIDTLETYYRCGGSVAPAARRLGIHRHTAGDRLRTARMLLGQDVDTFPMRLSIEAALIAYRLAAAGLSDT